MQREARVHVTPWTWTAGQCVVLCCTPEHGSRPTPSQRTYLIDILYLSCVWAVALSVGVVHLNMALDRPRVVFEPWLWASVLYTWTLDRPWVVFHFQPWLWASVLYTWTLDRPWVVFEPWPWASVLYTWTLDRPWVVFEPWPWASVLYTWTLDRPWVVFEPWPWASVLYTWTWL